MFSKKYHLRTPFLTKGSECDKYINCISLRTLTHTLTDTACPEVTTGTVHGGPAGTTGIRGTTGTVQGDFGGPGQLDGAGGSVREDTAKPGIDCHDTVGWVRKRKGRDDSLCSNPGMFIFQTCILVEW